MPLQEIRAADDRLLQDIADRITKSHKILVVTGAGISTSCGIPDFRSKDGLYDMIPEQYPSPTPSTPSTPSKQRWSPEEDLASSQASTTSTASRGASLTPTRKLKGQDLFDASVWKTPHTTEVFYRFIASLRQKLREEVKETSLTHKFIRTLRDGGRLMRCYTQNIDGLERRESLSMDMRSGKGTKKRFTKKIWEAPRPSEPVNTDADGGCEVVPLHGDLDVLRCTLCQETNPWSQDADEHFIAGLAPECERCASKSHDRQQRGKRSVAVGSLRPNIVLYGEEHPSNQLLAPLIPFDIGSGPEILIIMGTSLKVHGLQKIIRQFAKRIHARKDGKGRVICVNRTKPAESVWENVIDDYVAMDCDDWVRDLKTRRDDLWLRQGELDLKITKPKPTARKRKPKGDEQAGPCKRTKIVVEIPSSTPRSIPCTPWRADSPSDSPDPALLTPPPSRGERPVKHVDRAPTPEPLTPQQQPNHSRQTNTPRKILQPIFKTPSRRQPKTTRARNTWKPSILDDLAADTDVDLASPQRPEIFSPIEKSPAKKITVYQDVIPKENLRKPSKTKDAILDTPTKVVRKASKALRPISGPALNSKIGSQQAPKATKKKVEEDTNG